MNFTSEVVTQTDMCKDIVEQSKFLRPELHDTSLDLALRTCELLQYVEHRLTFKGQAEHTILIQNGTYHKLYEEYKNK